MPKKVSKPKIGIEYVESCNNTNIAQYYHEAMVELHRNGHGHQHIALNYELSAMVAYDAGTIVGLMIFEDTRWQSALTIVLGHVLESYRHMGVYTALWNKLVQHAQELGRPKIEGATHVGNQTMQMIMEHHGRKPTSVHYTFDVPPKTKKGSK